MKNIFRVMCAAVFLVGLMIFSLAQNSNQAQTRDNADVDIEPARPHVVKRIQHSINQDGSKKLLSQSTIYTKANGEYRAIVYRTTGPKEDNLLSKNSNEFIIHAGLSDGSYTRAAGSNILTYESALPDEEMLKFFRSHNSLRNNLRFVRTDKVAGLEVYVLRYNMDNCVSNIEWVEDSYSPKTGWGTLRSIMHFCDGIEVISEAVSVEFKEVPEDLNDDLKDLPINNLEEKKQKQRQN
jgi:hypothetical protein